MTELLVANLNTLQENKIYYIHLIAKAVVYFSCLQCTDRNGRGKKMAGNWLKGKIKKQSTNGY